MKFSPEKFKRIRVEKELTQKAISSLLDIKQNTISTWENGVRKPSDITLRKIAAKLEVDIASLIEQPTQNTTTNLSPLEDLLLRKFNKLDQDGKLFLLGITPEKYQALLDKIEHYKIIVKNLETNLNKQVS